MEGSFDFRRNDRGKLNHDGAIDKAESDGYVSIIILSRNSFVRCPKAKGRFFLASSNPLPSYQTRLDPYKPVLQSRLQPIPIPPHITAASLTSLTGLRWGPVRLFDRLRFHNFSIWGTERLARSPTPVSLQSRAKLPDTS